MSSVLQYRLKKKNVDDAVEAVGKLARELSQFIKDHYSFFQSFDAVKIYYDNGQVEVSKLLASVFHALLENVEFRRIKPQDYRLFQVADFVATLKLLQIKLDKNELSNAEKYFFGSPKIIRKNYLRILDEKYPKLS